MENKRKKFAFQMETPYSTASWPQISEVDQDALLELMCSLLAPLGTHRAQHSQPSRGRRSRKRQRKESDPQSIGASVEMPPAPELSSFVDLGLAQVTRRLQEAATIGAARAEKGDHSAASLYSVILIARSGYPSLLNSHLPQMVAAASKAAPLNPPIRLVGISKACEERLAKSTGIPRVSCVAVYGNAPNSGPLIDYARTHVPVIKAEWLEQAQRADHQETAIRAIETIIGPKKQPRGAV